MWQRIQSVFLGIAILCLFVSLFLPIWESLGSEPVYRLYPIYFMTKTTAGGQSSIASIYFPFSFTAVLIVASLTIAIQEFRRFDNRLLQIKLGSLNSLIMVGVMICSVLFTREVAKTHPELKGHYDISIYLCLIAVGCNWLAMRFIRRDEKLVRDSDRLR